MTTSDLHFLTKITYEDYGTPQVCYIDSVRAEIVAHALRERPSIENVELHKYVFVSEVGNNVLPY